jgi:hypothetical protein
MPDTAISLDILVIFYLQVTDYPSELAEREAVLLQIMDLANDAGVGVRLSDTDSLH